MRMAKEPKVGEYWIDPLGDKLLIKPEETKNVTKGGIVIPDDAVERTQRGYVVASGPGRMTPDGKLIPTGLEAGDYVIYAKYGGSEVKFEDGEVYILLAERDVHAILSRDD